MKAAVVVFPGTNCEHDVVHALGLIGVAAELVWHRETDLSGFDGVVLPGGFAHGDYLRTGAIARCSPIMDGVAAAATAGRPVLGICNGFQILCEAGLLPGALLPNAGRSFICRPVTVRVDGAPSALTAGLAPGTVLTLPLNSYEGNYQAAGAALDDLDAAGRVPLRYCGPDGEDDPAHNPNGSARAVAAVANEAGNVVGLMPHPERAAEELLGGTDGGRLLAAFASRMAAPAVADA